MLIELQKVFPEQMEHFKSLHTSDLEELIK